MGERSANDFLRLLYREGRIVGAELIRGLQSLNDLAAGNLRPQLAASFYSLPRKPRSRGTSNVSSQLPLNPSERKPGVDKSL
jgi:hypothetical protein